MTASKLLFSVLGSSIVRTHKTLTHPVRFPTPSLRFNRRNCSSTATLTAGSAQPPVLSAHLDNHPWPEWVNFVDRLKSKGYLSESTLPTAAPPLPPMAESGDADGDEAGVLYTDANVLKHACLNFARDRFDIFKLLSMQDIQTIVEKGCPNLFRKAVNSAKRLRAHLQLDEGDVCGACNLRGSCDRAYTIIKDSEASARTVDIVRILLFYALDPAVISEGEVSSGREDLEASARKLLSELTELSETVPDPELPKPEPKPAARAPRQKKESRGLTDDESYRNVEMKRGDWMCSRCNFMNFARNIRCLKCKAEGPKRISNEVEMKKGDWNCPECGFMNFASKIKCFRCTEPRPNRQLKPGEWECPSCYYLNYRRNLACKKCNCDRPKDEGTENGQQTWKRPVSFVRQ